MKKAKSLTQSETLELYRVALTNVESNPSIKEILITNGISDEILKQGSNLLSIAKEVSKTADAKRSKRLETYKSYSKIMADVGERFLSDRKKANMAFLHDTVAQDKLKLTSPYVKNYLKRIEVVKSFYTVVSENPDIAEQLAKYGLSTDDVNSILASILELEQVRANYINEKGISQNATNAKKKALNNLKMWMTRFFDIAKNALKHEPQLMESLYMVVKK